MQKFEILDQLTLPNDLKTLSFEKMEILAQDIRKAILYRDSMIGGHVGPNLGIVETAIALHYVFNSPVDKIVWDVSHQSYPHKILTGRTDGFTTSEGMKKISGYTDPDESEHDFFKIGHTSTAVSLACGLAKARDIKKETHNVIAILGDGSLSGGEALEGLNNAAVLNSNIIIIINDNEMSIAENHGGLYTNLRLLRQTKGLAECNLFKALGFQYHYIEEGNHIPTLMDIFQKVKDTSTPTIIHIHTLKGKGYSYAEQSKEQWHWSLPFNIESGTITTSFPQEDYREITSLHLIQKIKQDNTIVVVNAGTPIACGFNASKRKEIQENFIDVGIAEEHAVAFSSGLAKAGAKPIFLVMSSFIQRAYDQLSQDLALNKNPAVIIVFGGGISGMDMTHLGTFDIPLVSNIPNIVQLAPTTVEEYLSMLDWAIDQTEYPVVIRVPKTIVHTTKVQEKNYSTLNKFKIEMQGSKVAIIGAGSFLELAYQTQQELKKHNIQSTIINPRYLSGIDKECLEDLKQNHSLVVTLEDGEIEGGFGEKITRFYANSSIKVLTFGSFKEFTNRIPLEELYTKYRLTPELITQDILKLI